MLAKKKMRKEQNFSESVEWQTNTHTLTRVRTNRVLMAPVDHRIIYRRAAVFERTRQELRK